MSEKNIWNKFRLGDKSALETIYRTYFDDLYSYGGRFALDQSSVEDCIQELFIELWQKRENLSETDSIKPYLFLSLKRKIFRHTSKTRKLTDNALDESLFEAELAIDEILIQSENSAEQQSKLKNSFENLSRRQKEILYLKYYADMDYAEISKIMDLNYQSARNLVSRAILKLSKHMQIVIVLLLIKYWQVIQ